MPKARTRYAGFTREQIAASTEEARRISRYKFAEERIRKIVDGSPPLTAEQRDRLATLLRTARPSTTGRPE